MIRRRLLEQFGGRIEPLLVGLAVRHRDQLVALPPHHRIGAGQRFLFARIGLQISVERLLGQVGRIKAPARRLGRGAEERLVLVHADPTARNWHRISPAAFPCWGRCHWRSARGPRHNWTRPGACRFRHLARRLDQQIDHLAFLGVEEAGVGVHLNDRELLDRGGRGALGLRSGGVVGRNAASGSHDGQSGSGDQPAVFGHGRADSSDGRATPSLVRRRYLCLRIQLLPPVWTRGKLRITKSRYTSQSANHEDATARSLTVKRIKLGARNSSTHPSSQKRSPRREY